MNINFPVGGQPFRPAATASKFSSYPMSAPARRYSCRPCPKSPSLPRPPTATPKIATTPSPSLFSVSDNEIPLTPRPAHTDYLPTPPSSAIIEREEPAVIDPTNHSGKTIFHNIKSYLRRFDDHSPQPPLSLQIPNVPLVVFDDFLDTPTLHSLIGRSKLEYIAASHQIIVCAPPKPYHDCSPPFLHRVLQSLQRASFDTPARQDTLQVCENSWRAPNGSYLVPDAAIAVLDTESDATPRLWPTIVIEVANSQTYEDAVGKVGRWFRASGGMVEVALLMKFREKEPLVDPACFVEVFRCRPSAQGLEAEPEEPDASMAEGDPGLGAEDDDGDDQDDEPTAGDTTSSEDEDNTGTSTPARPATNTNNTALPETHYATDNDSSDTNTTTSDSSNDSTSSDASYEPEASPPLLEIYQDGPRHTILPAPSPDSSTQHIELQYSDFFGRENVPAGRDPAERVQLQLDLLRKELLVRLRLTQAQVGSLKRKGKERRGLEGEKRGRKV